MGDGGERVLMGDGVSTTRLDGWWEGAGASWWVMGIAVWGACLLLLSIIIRLLGEYGVRL